MLWFLPIINIHRTKRLRRTLSRYSPFKGLYITSSRSEVKILSL